MSDRRTVVVDAINYEQRIAVLDTGEIAPFETLLDRDGDEVDDIKDASVAVAKLPEGGWITIEFAAFAPRALS